MNLNYSELIKNSFQILKNNRALWFFGALISFFGSAVNSTGSAKDIVNIFPDKEKSIQNFSNPTYFTDLFNANLDSLGGLIIIVMLLVIVFALLILIVNMISTIAIIKLGFDAGKGQNVTIGQGFKEGFNYLIQLIGLNFVMYVPFSIVVMLVGTILISPGVVIAVMMKEKAFGVIIAFLGGLFWLLLLILSSLVLSVINIYASRYLIIEDYGIIESIKKGYGLLMKYKIVAVILWFINLGLGIMVGLVNYVVALLLGMPAALLSKFVSVYFNALLIFPLVSTLIIVGGFTVVSYNIWTIAFAKMTQNSKNPQEIFTNT